MKKRVKKKPETLPAELVGSPSTSPITVVPMDIGELKDIARIVARNNGYDMGPFEQNGDLWFATCNRSLCQIFVDPDRGVWGTAANHPCPKDAADKNVTFSHEPMSEEFKARLGKHWKSGK